MKTKLITSCLAASVLCAVAGAQSFTQGIRLDDTQSWIRPGQAETDSFYFHAVLGPSFDDALALRGDAPLSGAGAFELLTSVAASDSFRVLLSQEFTFGDGADSSRFFAEASVSHSDEDAGRLVWGLVTTSPLDQLTTNDHAALWGQSGMNLVTNPAAIVKPVRVITGNVEVDRIIIGQSGSVGLVAIPEPRVYAALFGLFALGFVVWRRRNR
ncbi:MAG: hypothetical protein JJU00_07855 [Opitutales bacterium]|nr:hypothetical protein [Opitutales bacterium]